MPYLLFKPDAKMLRRNDLAGIVDAPAVFNGRWEYQHIPSAFLRSRASPKFKQSVFTQHLTRPRRPTRRSMWTFGEALTNFLEWCEENSKRWEALSFTDDILEGYQADMLSGAWSASKHPLMPRTVNSRVSEACNFLEWAAQSAFRSAFDVKRVSTRLRVPASISTAVNNGMQVEVRAGMVRADPLTLRIPTNDEIRTWHKSVRIISGDTKTLMCELVLETGIRREEAVQWRVDTLPIDKTEWVTQGDSVQVTIRHGTKGQKHIGADGDEIGPARTICIPLLLALKLHDYRERTRPKLRANYVRGAADISERRRRMINSTSRLFLSDFTGEPVSAQRFYDAWKDSPSLPYKSWTVHLGRHWWACTTLLKYCKLRFQIAPADANYGDSHGVLVATAIDILRLIIKPQLGHVSVETSDKYIVWIQHMLMRDAPMHDLYELALESPFTAPMS